MKPGTVTERLQTESETDRTRERAASGTSLAEGLGRQRSSRQRDCRHGVAGDREAADRGSRQRQPVESRGAQ